MRRPATFAWSALGVCVACYVLGFLLFPPRVLVVADENVYVTQALAFARGTATIPTRQIFSSEEIEKLPSDYPPGTSALQAPFVRLGGWRGAAWLSVLSLIATVILLARWLASEGFSPLFALLYLAYLPALVLGRVGMSDVPSGAIVTGGLLLFWLGQDRRWGWWFGAGLVAGLSLLFRETNAIVFVPFFLGAILRRDRRWVALVAGGLTGLAARLLAAALLFGSPFYTRNSGYGWSVAALPRNAPLYFIALCLLLPGGLIAVALYRGRRRPELIASVTLTVCFFLFYEYGASESGRLKQLVLGPRYLIPLMPVVAFAMAEVASRWWRRAPRTPSGEAWAFRAQLGLVVAVACAVLAVHPFLDRWSKGQASIVEAIYGSTVSGAALVTNTSASQKFISPVYGDRLMVARDFVGPEKMTAVLRAHPNTFLVLVDRSDSDWYLADSRSNTDYLTRLQATCRLTPVLDAQEDAVDHLRIWKVDGCNSGS